MPSSSISQAWARHLLTRSPDALRLSPYVKERPSTKQAAALLLPHRCILYGGAAGGGKSSWLLMEALRNADKRGAALILRRESINLTQPGALIPRSHDWLAGTDAHWRGDEKTWTFPSGFRLKFGHMEHETDKHNYQSAEYETVCFEELTEFSESQFRYLFSRQRRPAGSMNPLRMCCATNPGNIGHDWVARSWGLGDYAAASEPAWAFLPAFIEDNPGLDQEAYLESLSFLSEFEQRQLRHGDWKARPKGDLFKVERIRYCNIEDVPAGLSLRRFWDLASTEETPSKKEDASAGVKGAIGPGSVLYVLDLQHFRRAPGGVREGIVETAEADGTSVRITIEQEPGSSGKIALHDFQTYVLPGFAVTGRAATGAKRSRWTGFEAAVEQRRVVFVRGAWNKKATDELGALTTDEAADAKNGLHDDITDALSGLYNECITAVTPTAWRPKR